MESLKTLVKKAKKGDGEAFVSLVKQYKDVLYRTASRLLNNDDDVADGMQDVIILAYEKLHPLLKSLYLLILFHPLIHGQVKNNRNRY